MSEFIKTCEMPKLEQEETRKMNKSTTSKYTEIIIKDISKTSSFRIFLSSVGFTAKFYQNHKVGIILALHK